MPLLQWWFKEFDVSAGEVVDVGTLKVTDINGRSITSDQLAQFFNALVKDFVVKSLIVQERPAS